MSTSAGKNLPPEIIDAILLLLPPKSLGRFKSVSKAWDSFISHPRFIKTHLLHHNNNQRCPQTRKLIRVSGDYESLYSIDTKELILKIPVTAKQLSFGSRSIQWEEISGSCNGLVLANDVHDNIFLINPTTKELWDIPPPPFKFPEDGVGYHFKYGFDYDPFTDDYKVVRISYIYFPDHPTKTYVSVYSLRMNSWKKLPHSPDHVCVLRGALVNYNSHWLTTSTKVVAFSFVDEEFSEIKMPDSFQNKNMRIYDFVQLGGKLGVFLRVRDVGEVYQLWVMQEYGNGKSWTRVCSHDFIGVGRPVCLVEGSDRDIVLDDKGEVVVFNIDEGRCRKVRIVGRPSAFTIEGTFVESIESPKRIVTAP